MNPKKVVEHYLKLSNALTEDKITVEQLNTTMVRDQQAFLMMKNKGLINEIEYQSLLVTIDEFEDIFETIVDAKVDYKSNGYEKD